MDQVGVKAPGRPRRMMLLSLAKSARLYFLGGNPWCNSTDGSLSPTEAKDRRMEDGETDRAALTAMLRLIKRDANSIVFKVVKGSDV